MPLNSARLRAARTPGHTKAIKESTGVIKKVFAKPIEYLSIPCMAAFVGISTNWLGVKMLFYPIEYTGYSLMRFDDHPAGLFGWQGVVPVRTEKMAMRLVDIVTRRLFGLTEAFGRLEAKVTANLLAAPVEESIRMECGDNWANILRPILPFVLQRVIKALQRDIEEVMDLPNLVLHSFVRDKQVLVNLFQKVGRVELEFLVESGFAFGFLLGIGQMALWAAKPKMWTLPVAGALVGYLTNYIAIKLLFEPANPVECGPFVLQGLFESRQTEVSEEFGHFMGTRVLNSPALLDSLSNEHKDRLHSFLRRELPFFVPEHIIYATISAIKKIAAKPHEHSQIHFYITNKLEIENTLSSRLKLLSPTDFEDILHPVFQEDEIILIVVGGILGALAGFMQTTLGWGGKQAKAKALATIFFSLSASAGFFLYDQKEEVNLAKYHYGEEIVQENSYLKEQDTIVNFVMKEVDLVTNVQPPALLRRTSIVRVRDN